MDRRRMARAYLCYVGAFQTPHGRLYFGWSDHGPYDYASNHTGRVPFSGHCIGRIFNCAQRTHPALVPTRTVVAPLRHSRKLKVETCVPVSYTHLRAHETVLDL